MDPYKVLQVDPEAEDEVIQAAYRRLAQKYHPDVAGTDGAARMASINAAWELLRDPRRRATVDRERGADAAATISEQRASRASSTPPSSGAASGPHRPPPGPTGARPPETVSTDWSSGRSSTGSGY